MSYPRMRRTSELLRGQRMALSILTYVHEKTPEEVVDDVEAETGTKPSLTTLWRMLKGVRTRPVFGLEEIEVRETFYTSSGIAVLALLEELSLRTTDRNTGSDPRALRPKLIRALKVLRELKRRLRRDRSVPVKDEADRSERRVDEAAIASLGQQICLYRVRFADSDHKKRRWARASLSCCNRGLNSIGEAGVLGSSAEPGDRILAARITVNGLFGSFVLDRLNRDCAELTGTRAFARRYGQFSMLSAAFFCGRATHDPRLPHYFAELAALLPHPAMAVSLNADVTIERPALHPVETAARLLFISKKLDGHQETPIRDWWPDWLSERLPQLESAIQLIEQAEQRHRRAA